MADQRAFATRRRVTSLPVRVGMAALLATSTPGCTAAAREASKAPEARPAPSAPRPASAPAAPARSTNHDSSTSSPVPTSALTAEGTPLGQFGTGAPILLHDAAPDGRWLSWCEARRDTNADGRTSLALGPQGEFVGDDVQVYFAVGGGAGHLVDGFVDASVDGRNVALIDEGRLLVLDTLAGTELDLSALGASLATDLAPYLPHRAARFSPTSAVVLYYRAQGHTDVVVVRDLSTGEEAQLPTVAGNLWRADFDESGRFVVAQVVDEDTNKNRKLDWPHPKARQGVPSPLGRGCSTAMPRFRVWRFPGDTPTPYVARLGAAEWTRVPGLIRPLGDDLLVRTDSGALELLAAGTKRLVVNDKCDARVLHVDASRRKIVAACMGSKIRGEVVVLGGPERIPLDVRVAGFELDRWERADPRLLALYPGQAATLVDMDTLTLRPLKDGDHVVATSGTNALVRDRKAARFVDGTGAATDVGALRLYEDTLQVGAIVAIPPFVVDVSSRRVLGTYDAPAVAVSSSGSVLVAAGDPGDVDRVPVGPLSWVAPTTGH